MVRRLVVVALVALGLSVTAGYAEDDQAYFAMFAETSLTVMPGMAGMADMLKNLPAGIELPAETMAMLKGGEPTRKLDIRLWSPGIAPKDAFAWVAPPEGLKAGKRLDLEIYRPKPDEAAGDDVTLPPGMPKFEEMTIKIYWGSSPTVKPGQPKIIKIGELTDEQRAAAETKMREAAAQGGYFYKPDWTTAHWPTEKQPGKIDPEASLLGEFALTTNYTGNVSITAPEGVDFLEAFTLSSPTTEESPDLAEALPIEWEAIPHALGLHAGITGFEGRNTIVMWTSSEVLPDDGMMPDMDYLEMAQVRDYVAEGFMMAGDATEATVPEGIFEKCAMPMLMMVGYGPGASLPEGQPLPRIQTKTTLMMQLGDMMKGAAGMMGGFGSPDGGEEEE
jgi:hypothetical protein